MGYKSIRWESFPNGRHYLQKNRLKKLHYTRGVSGNKFVCIQKYL